MSLQGLKTTTFIMQLTLLLVLLSGCLPQPPRAYNPNLNSNLETTPQNESETEQPPTPVLLAQNVNFFQVGTQKEASTLSLYSDFNDTFLMRGNQLNQHLRQFPSPLNQKFCFVTKFIGASGNDAKEILIMSGRVKSFLNYSSNQNEYYVQINPHDSTINTTDCITNEILSLISSKYSSMDFTLNISGVCPSCNSGINSNEIFIYSPSGTEQTELNISHLRLAILPERTENITRTTCASNTSCETLGFDCCLDGQCINHGEVIDGVNQNTDEFLIASQIIEARPELIINYNNLFYICPTMVETNPDNSPIDPNLDPAQEAADRFETLEELYNCINPIFDEYSVCTKTFYDMSESINSGGHTFAAAPDDLTFKSINSSITYNNIKEITYGNIVLFKEGFTSSDTSVPLDIADGQFQSASNDNFVNSQSVQINKTLPSSAINDNVKIRYTIDGTCVKLGSTLAKCTKSYIQGQSLNPARPSNHPSGKQFDLPSYADLNFNLLVEVNNVRIAQDATTWQVSGQGIKFDNSYPIFNNQEVKITYFVSNNVDLLTQSKSDAQSKVNTFCACDPKSPCNLKPETEVINNIEKIVDYSCVYPESSTFDPPLRETVYISSKTAAHRYFDVNGVSYTNSQLFDAPPQEGVHFQYEGNNEFKPNNADQYIGFNEIYGTFNLNSTSAIPATEIDVVKGRRYDLWTESGVFSSCLNCGSDYYSSLIKTFPTEFSHFGSGYLPSLSESRRILNQSKFPADDMLFGRACFVPATMIPWTHVPNDDVPTQRKNRLAAQHFLFANGYNKDWYGFDYGSVIGSFDGVHWFSVGNARRVQATSNKLYLAVNAYFGDVTTNNSYQITIQESVAVLFNGFVFDPDKDSILFHDPDTVISTDMHSFGAQCQRFHLCENDNDCLTRLGYDYVCSSVGGVKSSWPLFDSFGREQSGEKEVSLLSLSGGSNGFPKRCVYRGKGAPCEVNSHSINNADNTYSKSDDVELNVCSPNNYCEELTQSKFNTRIARIASNPKNQNLKSFITEKSDTFGLTARILGRPLKFLGDEAVPEVVKTQLQSTNVKSICIPGKDPERASRIEDLNHDVSNRKADNILNIGKTYSSDRDEDYLTACPAIDNEENSGNAYTYLLDENLDNPLHRVKTISQNISTNRMKFFDTNFETDFFNDDDDSNMVEKVGFTKNSCMRAPGASCFTDLDCAPNHWVSNKISAITESFLNEAEADFWKEDLVCANAQQRKLSNSSFDLPEYDLRSHKCCREIGKPFTFYSQKHKDDTVNYINTNTLELKVPGIDSTISNAANYSRVHTIYDKVTLSPIEYPAPLVPAAQNSDANRMTQANFKLRQYNTLHLHNSRMCCSGHWVRKFASGENGNGGGHTFGPNKQQNINNIEEFKTLNWTAQTNGSSVRGSEIAFGCNINDAETNFCEIRNIPEDSEKDLALLKWFAKFELLGIPQVLIENSNHFYKPLNENQAAPGNKTPFVGFFNASTENSANKEWDVKMTPNSLEDGLLLPNLSEVSNQPETNPVELYSAANGEHFDLGGEQRLKKVFEPNEFNCCIPTGIEITDASVDSNDCCSGLLSDFNGPRRCCLNDFTDVTVYTNRYVSSEGVKFQGFDIPEGEVDPVTGYLSKEIVLQMAATMCCSGQADFGVAISELFIPLESDNGSINGSDPSLKSRRWIYNNSLDTLNGTLQTFREGQKWNHHVYCIPGNSSGGSGAGGGAVSQ